MTRARSAFPGSSVASPGRSTSNSRQSSFRNCIRMRRPATDDSKGIQSNGRHAVPPPPEARLRSDQKGAAWHGDLAWLPIPLLAATIFALAFVHTQARFEPVYL